MKLKILRLVLRALIALRINRITRVLSGQRVVILCYHGFREDDTSGTGVFHEGRHLARSTFRRQLEYLAGQGRVVDLRDALRAVTSGNKIAAGSVVVTVDDGYRSFAEIGAPELIKAGTPATLFVATGMVDRKTNFWVDRLEYAIDSARAAVLRVDVNGIVESFDLSIAWDRAYAVSRLRDVAKLSSEQDRKRLVEDIERGTGVALAEVQSLPDHLQILSWDEIRDASESGLIAVGSHSVTHPIMTSCSDETVRREVTESKIRITEEVGEDCGIFCYPNGAEFDFDSRTKTALLKAGYAGALTTVSGSNDHSTDRFELRRHMIDDRASWSEFVARVDGLFDVLTLLWSRLAKVKTRNSWRAHNGLALLESDKEWLE